MSSPAWPNARLGDVTESMKNGIYRPANVYADDGIACLRMYNIEAGKIAWRDIKRMRLSIAELADYRLLPGDILVNRVNSRELVGKAAVIPDGLGPVVFESKNIRLRLDRQRANPRFINYQLLLNGARHFLWNAQQVVGMASINQKQLADFPVVLLPLLDQEHIVAEIEKQFSRLDEAVANLKRVKANLKRYRAAVLKAAVEGRLVADEFGVASGNNWPLKPIDVAIASMDQGWSPRCDRESSDGLEAWGVIKTTAVQPLSFVQSENKRLPDELMPREHLELAVGDVLVTRAGPRSRVGVACLIRATRPRLILCDKVYRLRARADVAKSAFLELVLNAPHIVDALDVLKTGISDSGVNLTQKRFRELSIPIPPIEEQGRIVTEVERRLSMADESEAQVDANLLRAERLRQAILKRAFGARLG